MHTIRHKVSLKAVCVFAGLEINSFKALLCRITKTSFQHFLLVIRCGSGGLCPAVPPVFQLLHPYSNFLELIRIRLSGVIRANRKFE